MIIKHLTQASSLSLYVCCTLTKEVEMCRLTQMQFHVKLLFVCYTLFSTKNIWRNKMETFNLLLYYSYCDFV